MFFDPRKGRGPQKSTTLAPLTPGLATSGLGLATSGLGLAISGLGVPHAPPPMNHKIVLKSMVFGGSGPRVQILTTCSSSNRGLVTYGLEDQMALERRHVAEKTA